MVAPLLPQEKLPHRVAHDRRVVRMYGQPCTGYFDWNIARDRGRQRKELLGSVTGHRPLRIRGADLVADRPGHGLQLGTKISVYLFQRAE